MNYLKITIQSFIFLTLLTACSQQKSTPPSQNAALNSITKSSANTSKGSMQNSLTKWIEDEWTPTVEKNETIQKVNDDKKRNFTLQEYVDKMEVYSKESKKTQKSSHTEKLNSLPVIGK